MMNYIKSKLQEQIGSLIVKSSAGGSVGTIWKLELDNGNFFFIHCTWRLFKDNEIIMTSQDSTDPNEVISTTTPILEKHTIENIILSEIYDISIFISNHYRLDIFCDMGPKFELYDDATNWDLSIPSQDKAICINNKLKARKEKYY